MNPSIQARRPFEVIAHRGVRTHSDLQRMPPENTLPAFQEAAQMGASIELDVIATTDGRLMVHHDDQTGRMFTLPNGDRLVRNTSFQDISAARFNQAGHEATVRAMLGPNQVYQTPTPYTKVTIPELETVLTTLPNTPFYVELKTYDHDVRKGTNNQLEERIVKLIQEKNLYNRVTVISFSPLSLRKVKQLDPRIQTGLDFEFPAIVPKKIRENALFLNAFVTLYAKQWLGVGSIHSKYEETSPKLVQKAHQAGLRIAPWVNHQTRSEEQALFPALMAMGVDGIITNAVDLLQEALPR